VCRAVKLDVRATSRTRNRSCAHASCWVRCCSPSSSASVAAPPPQYLFVDDSSSILIDHASAVAIWQAQVDDNMRLRLQKLYPVSKWGFISQVQGGFTTDGVCVVTARAVLVPRVLGSRPRVQAAALGRPHFASKAESRPRPSAAPLAAAEAHRTRSSRSAQAT
jgi:hypothetical protein